MKKLMLIGLLTLSAPLIGCDYKGNPSTGPSACSRLAVDLHRDHMFGIGVMDSESQGYCMRECRQSGSGAVRAGLMMKMRADYMEWVRKELPCEEKK